MHPSQVEFLQHILDECVYLIQESENTIGEASSKVHPDLKAKYPFVSWREMSDIRNKIIHHYFGVDYDIVWDTVKTNIPALKEGIEVIIEKEK
jgi:uncharacterized protein with HEPN domain